MPSRRSPAERRAEIAAAARAVALREGLGALTLRAVAAETGVASGLVAHYEPSMEALVARTFDELARAELDEVARLAGDGPALGRLRSVLATLLAPGRDDVSSLWADAWSRGRRSPTLAAATRSLMGEWSTLADEILAAGIAEGAFATATPELVSLQMFALLDSTTAYALVGYREASERSAVVFTSMETALGLPAGALTEPQ